MKVTNNKISGNVDAAKTGRTESAQGLKKNLKANALGGRDVAGGSKVDVSERAQMMQKARDIASESSIDEAKVAKFQKLIDEGKYNVDADKVADRLVDEHLLIPD
jgi:negative regulator of flagellin synthesis FlgM